MVKEVIKDYPYAEYATRMGEFQLAKAAGFSEIGAAFFREVATENAWC